MMSRDELLELIPAYVLGALDEDERIQVEVLLASDTEAQVVEAEYRQIAEVLPFMATSYQASSDLKDRLLQRINENDSPANILPLPPQQQSSVRRYILPLVAGITVAIIGLLFAVSSIATPTTPEAVFLALANQVDSKEVVVEPSEDAPTTGRLLVSGDGQQAVLRVQDLPSLNANQIFQLWLIDADGSKSGGIYQAGNNAELYLVIPNEKAIDTYVAFGISVEPEGGSPLGDAPSSDPIFAVSIPQEL